jgi:hypothetical protein
MKSGNQGAFRIPKIGNNGKFILTVAQEGQSEAEIIFLRRIFPLGRLPTLFD